MKVDVHESKILLSMMLTVLPSFTAISPIAQVALLQTEINSGFKFCPSIGRNSATFQNKII